MGDSRKNNTEQEPTGFGYQFVKKINSLIPHSQAILQQEKIIGIFPVKDGCDAARQALTSLQSELERLNKIVLIEEQNRQQFRSTSQMLSDRKDAETACEKAKSDYDQLQIKLTQEKEGLELDESRLINEIRQKTVQLGSAQGSEIVTDNLAIDKLSEQKKALNRRIGKLQRKCCPNKEQKKELAEAEDKVVALAKQIQGLETDRAPEEAKQKEIAELKKQLEQVRDKIKSHNDDQQLLAAAKKKITDTRIEYEKINERERQQQERHYARQSKVTTVGFLRAYVRFMEFKYQIDNLDINNKLDKKKLYKAFKDELNEVKDRLDEIVDIVWCPVYENQTARQLYDDLTDETRKALFADELPLNLGANVTLFAAPSIKSPEITAATVASPGK